MPSTKSRRTDVILGARWGRLRTPTSSPCTSVDKASLSNCAARNRALSGTLSAFNAAPIRVDTSNTITLWACAHGAPRCTPPALRRYLDRSGPPLSLQPSTRQSPQQALEQVDSALDAGPGFRSEGALRRHGCVRQQALLPLAARPESSRQPNRPFGTSEGNICSKAREITGSNR